MARPSTLPAPAEELVLKALKRSKKPLSAYDLLEKVGRFGIKSSPIVYRALAALTQRGAAHKIHALNAYVACACGADHDHDLSIITICRACQRVDELHDHAVIHHLTKLRRMQVNLPHAAVVELPVTCKGCAQ